METFGKASPGPAGTSATVDRVARSALRLAAARCSLAGGLGLALLAAGPAFGLGSTATSASAASTTPSDDELGEGGARARRPRLGPRPRDEPVGRLRLREARLELRPHPRPLLHRHHARAGERRRPCACCSSTAKKATLELGRALDASPTAAGTPTQARRRATLVLKATARRSPAAAGRCAPPFTFSAAGAALGRRHAVPRQARPSSADGQARPGGRRRRARAVPAGRRSVGDAVGLAGRGAEGAGGRGPLVRAREPREGSRRSTSTATRAARSTAASPPSRRRRTPPSTRPRARSCSTTARSPTRSSSRPPAAARRRRSRRPATRRAVPRLGARSVRHALAVPRLGPGGARRGEGREGAEAAGADRRPARRTNGPSGRVRSVTAVSADDSAGDRHRRAGPRRARPALDLVHARRCSARCRPAKTMTYGGEVSLTGRGARRRRRVARVEDGGAAGLGGRGRADAGRRRRVLDVVRPQVDDEYRLAWGDVRRAASRRSPSRRASTRPSRARARQRLDQTRARGRAGAAPAAARDGLDDRPSTVTRRGGRFDASPARSPGTYRVRCAPGHGLAPGVSAPLRRRSEALRLASRSPSPRSRCGAGGGAAFDNIEPLARQQWYLDSDRAWSTSGRRRRSCFPVKRRRDRLRDRRRRIPTSPAGSSRRSSFVGGSPYRRRAGPRHVRRRRDRREPDQRPGHRRHGVQRAAADREGRRAPTARSRSQAEVAAIRWAVDNGARVINLSLGGVRDPLDPTLDTYSPLEQAAVEYAYSKGAVVVAAVGNGAAVAGDAVAVRALSGGAAARDRRQRGAAGRLGAGVLEPRRGLQRPRRAGRRRSSRRSRAIWSTATARLRRPAVLRLRPGRVPGRDRHVVRGAAGLRGGGAAARRRTRRSRPTRSRALLERSADDVNAGDGLPQVPARPRRVHRLGDARRRDAL